MPAPPGEALRTSPPLPPPPQMPATAPEPVPWQPPVAPPPTAGHSDPGIQGVSGEARDVTAADVEGFPGDGADVAPLAGASASGQHASVVAPVAHGDWLASVCPYLASEDGTYRSTAADNGHRCTAQDPAGTLPLAFQEHFCLTDRHVRCEMYKYAQETNADGGIPVAQIEAAAPRTSRTSGDGGNPRGPIIIAAAAIGGVVIVVFLLAVLLGSCSGEPATPTGDPSPTPQTSDEPKATPSPTPKAAATPKPTPKPDEVDPGATSDASETPQADGLRIYFEVQEDEKLVRIAELFGVKRKDIIAANEGMADKSPFVQPGDIIIVPVSSEMTIEEIEDVPGYQGRVG